MFALSLLGYTGESEPQEKIAGSDTFAGSIVESGALDIEMTKAGKDTVFSRIISLVEEAESQQAPIEKFTDKVASWLIPIVFINPVFLVITKITRA